MDLPEGQHPPRRTQLFPAGAAGLDHDNATETAAPTEHRRGVEASLVYSKPLRHEPVAVDDSGARLSARNAESRPG